MWRVREVSCGVREARALSNSPFMPAATGLSTSIATRPSMKAAAAAGRMKRQAETPAARMAISSLRRFMSMKAPRMPNRKTKGRSCRITDGDFSSVRPSSVAKLISVRPPRLLDRSMKSMSRTTAPSRAVAAPMPTRA